MLLREGGPVKQLVALVTHLNDRLTLRILKLAEKQMESDGLGGPPAPYSWIALGSEGRMEQTLHTDQDNALFFSNVCAREEAECKRWFLKFSELVVDSLVRSGIPPCPGGIMASNPQWCQSERWWQDTFLKWITDPNPHTLLMASIFFDFRPIFAGTEFPGILEDKLLEAVRRNRLFIRFMAKNALHNQPPLGLLKQVFGYHEFHENQREIIECVLGGNDAFVLMPTGGGKSLCYQIPAMIAGGVGIVVSPLIALMEDQVKGLWQYGVRAAYLNSTLSYQKAPRIYRSAADGRLDLLYVAPEKLLTQDFQHFLANLDLALFAIDEAHCVSQWGHDFRPEYLRINEVTRRFPEVPRIALTATADAATRKDILDKLALQNAEVFIGSFDRPNIRYALQVKRGDKQ